MDTKELILFIIIIATTFFIVIGTLPGIASIIPVGLLLTFLLYKKHETTPKSIEESVKVAREFISRILYNERKPIEISDIVEASRHKEFAYGSKKRLIHKIVMRLKDGTEVAVIDDPYIRHNPASVIHYSIISGHVPKPVKSAVELEREIRPRPILPQPSKIKKKIEIKKKEESKS